MGLSDKDEMKVKPSKLAIIQLKKMLFLMKRSNLSDFSEQKRSGKGAVFMVIKKRRVIDYSCKIYK